MMALPSKYSADTAGAEADVVGYNIDYCVLKPDGSGKQLFQRIPAPEVLMGDPALIRAAIRAAPGKHKYKSLVLSFADDDIDVEAFNSGSPEVRAQVATVLALYIEAAFAGIPEACRPPILVSTHTHCGNLELNIIIPRWVRRPDGQLRCFNPDPPGRASRAYWDAFEDLLNTRYGWSDPRDPARRQWVTLPGFLMKKRASVLRSGVEWKPTTREIICDRIVEAIRVEKIKSRADVEVWLQKYAPDYDITVLKVADDHITIGAEDALPRDRIKLSGLIFSRAFSSPQSLRPELMVLDDRARADRLADAAARLRAEWVKRVTFNVDRFRLADLPAPNFGAASFLDHPGSRPLRIIPPRRIDHATKLHETETHHDRSPEPAPLVWTDGDGTGTADPGRRAGTVAPPRPSDAERNDSSARVQGPREGRSHQLFVRVVDILAGPRGPSLILTAFVRRLRAVLPNLVARLTLRHFLPAIPPNLPDHLQHCKTALETMNAALARQLAARRRPEDRQGHRPETRPDPACDPSASRIAAGSGDGGTGPHPAIDRNPRELFAHRDAPPVGGRGAHQTFRDRSVAEGRGAGVQVAGAEDRGAGRTDRDASWRSEDDHGMALDADGPATRAQMIAKIRTVAETVERGARFSLRLLPGDPGDPRLPQEARSVWISLVPGESWVLTASDAVLDAVAEAFGLAEDQPSIEDHGTSFETF